MIGEPISVAPPGNLWSWARKDLIDRCFDRFDNDLYLYEPPGRMRCEVWTTKPPDELIGTAGDERTRLLGWCEFIIEDGSWRIEVRHLSLPAKE